MKTVDGKEVIQVEVELSASTTVRQRRYVQVPVGATNEEIAQIAKGTMSQHFWNFDGDIDPESVLAWITLGPWKIAT